MRRGTTPTITIKVKGNLSVDLFKTVIVTLKQGDIQVDKTNSDIEFDAENNVLNVFLTQEDTLVFRKGQVSIQVRVLTFSEEALASQIINKSIDDILYEGEIE